MKAIVNAWTSLSLIKRIVIGLIIGALIGLFGPKDIIVIELWSGRRPGMRCSFRAQRGFEVFR